MSVVPADVLGPLPQGTVVLEASAGTGKTWTIAALATRYVAEAGLELSQLMLVTFGRAATQELRERTRTRLTSAAFGLADVEAARAGDDVLLAHLATGSDHEVAERRRRLLVALSDFDAATITTTHSFCQRMLDGLGIAGDRDLGAQLVEDLDDLVTEVADDLYLRTFADHEGPVPQLSPADARQVARDAVGDRQARLVPSDAPAGSEAAQRIALAHEARHEVERRKRAAGVRDFDDLLVLLRDALADPVHGEAGCARVRERYRVVLVDEFQDTDPVQWEVLQRAFHGATTLVLIGDPKQAIYAFRGAEVLSYLDAVRQADRHETLGVNHRTDADLVRGLDVLYGGAALGHPDIAVRPVQAARAGSRLPGEVPLRVRQVPRTGCGPLGRSGFPAVAALRRRVAADLADELVRLFTEAALVADDGPRPVRPGDVAVLVRKRLHIAPVREALDAAGIPSVVAGATSVFETPAATDWLWFLQALEQPNRPGPVRLAALTPLLGLSADTLDDRATTDTSAFLRELSLLFAGAGFAAVVERLATRTELDARLLARTGGERRLTDLRHLAQVLDRATVEDSLGLTALVGWLAERVADPKAGSSADRSRRLESDAAAVQILTVHTSKGLEFPVVHVPFGWDGAKSPAISRLLLHDEAGHRVLDLGGKSGPGWAERQAVSDREEAGEELRLLYVALTRAQSQVVAWWAPGAATSGASLHRLLLGRTAGEPEPALRAPVPADDAVTARLGEWAAAAPDVVAVEPVGPATGSRWTPPADHPPALGVARVTRVVDRLWRRTSYSALTASAHEAAHVPGVGSEPERTERTDEPVDVAERPLPMADDAAAGPPSPMDDLPAGVAFGTLVHEVLEQVDPTAADLEAELLARSRAAVAARLADVDPTALATALLPVLRTPLDVSGVTLADLPPSDRLAELDFELPLAGGSTPRSGEVTLQGVAALLRRHLPADDPLAGYPDLLETLEAPALRGFLSGSIDAVLRLPGPRYVVVDYKTNRLGRGSLTALHYTRAAMAAEMLRAHYPLQALVYAVALHRYLRWRQPGYDPAAHLGGTAYLFVRGMVGPDTPAGCGVFDWHPSPELVVALSDLLAGA